MLLGGVGLSSPYPSSKSSKDNYSQFLHFLGLIGLILMLERPRWHKKALLIAEKGFNFGRGDRIASPSSCFPSGTFVPENTASNLLALRFDSSRP